MSKTPLRIALIGCGQIADAHLQELRLIEGTAAVAVCDRHLDLAKQAAARFDVPHAFDSVADMLATARPHVVHVTTPPHTHAALAVQCLNANAHVYVEKPFTVNVHEADTVLRAAERNGRLVCLGHDQLFDPVWLECRQLYESGALGDIVHVDTIWGYDLDGPFGRLLAGNTDHWVHRLPGGLFQNVISHGLARIMDFLPDAVPRVQAEWFRMGLATFPSELRVYIRGERATGSLMFTTQARPAQKWARVYGTRMTVEIDFDARVVRKYRAPSAPSALAKVQLPWWQLKDAAANFAGAVKRLSKSDLRFFAGMQELLRRFYAAIETGGPVPVSHAEARRVTGVMDAIFQDCRLREAAGIPPEQIAAGRLTA